MSWKIDFRVAGKNVLDRPGKSDYNVSCNSFGPVAQLGAHHIRIVGVVGSNPIRSTKTGNRRSENCGDFSFDHRNTTDGFLF